MGPDPKTCQNPFIFDLEKSQRFIGIMNVRDILSYAQDEKHSKTETLLKLYKNLELNCPI